MWAGETGWHKPRDGTSQCSRLSHTRTYCAHQLPLVQCVYYLAHFLCRVRSNELANQRQGERRGSEACAPRPSAPQYCEVPECFLNFHFFVSLYQL